ncbi:MAG TPA: CoA transferase, partial [Burkholderiaceae bacterium]|nr:CoA transferase [Burkholderiaceae bacterium]
LMRAGVPAGVVNSVPEAFAHPHCEHREILVRRGEYTGVRSPMRLLGTPGTPGRAPPAFAQDTAEVLSALGFTDEQCGRLYDAGAVYSN